MINIELAQSVSYRGGLDRADVEEVLAQFSSSSTPPPHELTQLSEKQLAELLEHELTHGGNSLLGPVLYEMIEKNNDVTGEAWTVKT